MELYRKVQNRMRCTIRKPSSVHLRARCMCFGNVTFCGMRGGYGAQLTQNTTCLPACTPLEMQCVSLKVVRKWSCDSNKLNTKPKNVKTREPKKRKSSLVSLQTPILLQKSQGWSTGQPLGQLASKMLISRTCWNDFMEVRTTNTRGISHFLRMPRC